MRRAKLFLSFCLLVPGLAQMPGEACTAFCLGQKDAVVVGKNYDWDIGDALVVVNKRNMNKIAMTSNKPVGWTSKYGSVTFNQYGREMPSGGMNEAGLVVEVLWLKGTEYAPDDARPTINNAQWVQYQLDNFSTVDEVVRSDAALRIMAAPAAPAALHYFVCDKQGHCASIEMLSGKFVAHTREDMPVRVLTNSTYAEALDALKTHLGAPLRVQGFGGAQEGGRWPAGEMPQDNESPARFVRAAQMAGAFKPETGKAPVDYAFDILGNVAQKEYTQWSIVYDVAKARVVFQTSANSKRRHIDLPSLDFSCATPVKILDINADLEGNITDNFTDYSVEANKKLITNSFSKSPRFEGPPEELLESLAQYPDSTVCTE